MPKSKDQPNTPSQTSDESSQPVSNSRQLVVVEEETSSHFLSFDWLKSFLKLIRLRQQNRLDPNWLSLVTNEALNAKDPAVRHLLHNVLKLNKLKTHDIMMPRADIDAVDQSISLGELMQQFEQSGHSRMPVYNGTLDDPVGMVHIKDVMSLFVEKGLKKAKKTGKTKKTTDKNTDTINLEKINLSPPLSKSGILRDILFIPSSMLARDVMGRMQSSRTQMALVVDEYGGTDGLICLEDIVETIFGDIEDEHDAEDTLIEQIAGNIWLANARIELEDFFKVVEIPAPGHIDEDIDTLGGLIFNTLGRIPVRGELLRLNLLPGLEFEVIEADMRRLKRLRIRKRQSAHAAPQNTTG